MNVLGIESSCDDSCAALVKENGKVIFNHRLSKLEYHNRMGGVVPEVAARNHMLFLPKLLKDSLDKHSQEKIGAVAVTQGPGLIGGLLVGISLAKGIAFALNVPLIGINHLEAHVLTIRWSDKIKFPFIALLVSGGHLQILIVEGVGKYKVLGKTLDDALGEAFDKVARMLGLGYPGGPIIEQYALQGNPYAFDFPMAMCKRKNFNFSFSGIKTAVRNVIQHIGNLSEKDKANIAASFQRIVKEILINKIGHSINEYERLGYNTKKFVIAGGVASNEYLRTNISSYLDSKNYKLVVAPKELCTDNALMIAWAGIEKIRLNQLDGLDLKPKSRMPLG